MDKIIEPTAEEKAYHAGWNAYFQEKHDNMTVDNPFDPEVDKILNEKWEEGRQSAESVTNSMEE